MSTLLSKKYIIIGALAVLGAVAGYAYWYYVGCLSGTCSITSKWTNSTLYGTVMGGLIGSMISDYSPKKVQE